MCVRQQAQDYYTASPEKGQAENVALKVRTRHMAKQTEKTVLEYLYGYQTRLQGVANDLAIKLAALTLRTDESVAKLLIKELPLRDADIKKELVRVKKLIVRVEKLRKPTYDAARDLVFETSASVLQKASEETVKECNRALAEQRRKAREERFCKTLSEKQQKAILDGQGIDGGTIAEWLSKWERADLERITSVCQRASVESLSVDEISKAIRGSKESNFSDGILTTTKVGATMMARTIINGVSNNARVETIKANDDVIDGVKFVGTLDGKTCPHCGAYDGQIWRGEDVASARRPPIHPNCRCTLVPYVELRDEEGNVVELEEERPAANADFDALAKEAYNAQAKQKGWNRRWEDLSASTRLKYYYQAQKDYEKETGEPAYRQVPSSLTFEDYFKAQPESFKRAWLGAKRYELYQKGSLNEKNIFSPDLGYRARPGSLDRDELPESEQISELANTETEERRAESRAYQDGVVMFPTQDKKPTEAEWDDIARDIGEKKEAAISEFRATSRDEFRRLKHETEEVLSNQGKSEEDIAQAISVLRTKYTYKQDAYLAARFSEIHKSAVDILRPVDDANSKNRAYTASLYEDSFLDNIRPEYKEDVSIVCRAALDFVGRIYDNIGFDAQSSLGLRKIRGVYGGRDQGGYDRGIITINFKNFTRVLESQRAIRPYYQILFRTFAHEMGHPVEENLRGAQFLVQELRSRIAMDANGNSTPFISALQHNLIAQPLQRPTINVPWLYAMHVYPAGQTEMTSVYFETLASRPDLLLLDRREGEDSLAEMIAGTAPSWEFGVRMGEVLRETIRYKQDYEAIISGHKPRNISGVFDSLQSRVENAQTAVEKRMLWMELGTRTRVWEKIQNDSRPKRKDYQSQEEYETALRSWINVIEQTQPKIRGVVDIALSRLTDLNERPLESASSRNDTHERRRRPDAEERKEIDRKYQPKFIRFTPENIDSDFPEFLQNLDDYDLSEIPEYADRMRTHYLTVYMSNVEPDRQDSEWEKWNIAKDQGRDFYRKVRAYIDTEINKRDKESHTTQYQEPTLRVGWEDITPENIESEFPQYVEAAGERQLQKLLSTIEEGRSSYIGSYLYSVEPPEGDKYEAERSRWITQRDYATKFYDTLEEYVKAEEEKRKKAREEYTDVPVELDTPFAKFTPENLTELPSLLAQFKVDTFNSLDLIVDAAKDAWMARVPRELTKEDEKTDGEFWAYMDARAKNIREGEAFFRDLKKYLAVEKQRRLDLDPKWEAQEIVWESSLGRWEA